MCPHMEPRPIMVDLDETLFPFVHRWDEWLRQERGEVVNWEAFTRTYDVENLLPGHLELQPHFIRFLRENDQPPIPEAAASLEIFAAEHPIIACTARNRSDWYEHTHEWVARHLPFIHEIVFIRENRGEPATPKSRIAQEKNAYALIDDTAAWVTDLPTHTKGFVVVRPDPLASDFGAQSWPDITVQLLGDPIIE